MTRDLHNSDIPPEPIDPDRSKVLSDKALKALGRERTLTQHEVVIPNDRVCPRCSNIEPDTSKWVSKGQKIPICRSCWSIECVGRDVELQWEKSDYFLIEVSNFLMEWKRVGPEVLSARMNLNIRTLYRLKAIARPAIKKLPRENSLNFIQLNVPTNLEQVRKARGISRMRISQFTGITLGSLKSLTWVLPKEEAKLRKMFDY